MPIFRKSVYPLYVYIENLTRNSRILRRYYGKTIKDRDLKFCMSPRNILKTKSAKFQDQILCRSWFFRYPIFNFYTITYNSAGKFSTILKTFSPGRVFQLSTEQGASPPVLRSRGLRPLPRGLRPRDRRGVFFPPVALASAVITKSIMFILLH